MRALASIRWQAVLVVVMVALGMAAEARGAVPTGAADNQRVAVLRLGFEGGGVPEAARDLFSQRLLEGLAAAQLNVLPRVTVRERLAMAGLLAEVAACRSGACFVRAAAALEVAFLIVGAVDEHDKTYDITLELVNGKSGVTLGISRERCEICGIEEATEKMGLAASALRGRLEALVQTPARFIIRSRPAGARVSVDGLKVGRTPIDHELAAGVHKLALAAPGYDPLERTVTAVSGVDETLDLELVPLPTKFPYRLAGAGALLVAAAAFAGGIWALAVDGDPLSCGAGEADARGGCPSVRNTRVAGAVLFGVGAAAGTLGGTWLYLGSAAGAARGVESGTNVATLNVAGRF